MTAAELMSLLNTSPDAKVFVYYKSETLEPTEALISEDDGNFYLLP